MTGTEFSGREIHENRGGWVGLHPERLLFFLVLSCLITPQRVLAQALCSEPVVTLEYDCSTVPEESPSGAWSIVDSETYDSTWHSDGNNLYLDACATHGSAVFYRVEESLATAEKMAIEVRAYVTCHVTTTWLPGIFLGFGISDGTKLVLVWPVGSLEEGRIGVNYSGNYFQSEPGATDWSMPATYRLVLDKSSADPAVHVATVLVNGVTVLTVPYDELDDVGTLPYEIASPHLFGIGANNSDTVWDRVGYEICEQQATPEPPPIEEQITNMQEAAEFLDAPRPVHLWLQGHLEHAGQIDDPLEQGQAFYRIGRQFFMMKFAGVVAGDAAEFETLLDFARDTVAPEIERQEGYLGKLYINSALVKTPYVVPGRESAHLRVFASLKPAGKHINNPDGDIFGLKARVSVINITTGDVVRVQESLQQLPDRLPPGEIYRAAALDFFWDGQKDDGTRAVPGESYFIDATVEYVDFGEDISMIPQPLDGAMIVFRPDIELYDISEVSAGRSFLGTATKVTDETVDLGNGGRFFIHTENLSQSSDPVIHVLEPSTGVQQAANDDCETTLSLPCVDDNENEINCPDIQGTKNACVLVDSGLVKNYALRIVVHANANHLQGSGDLVIWKRVATDSLGSAYKRISVNSNQSFGGTRIRFISGWYGGDEMDLIIPSPERCRDEIGEDFSPAHVPGSLYLLASTTEITDSRSGNIMAGGALIWYLNQTNEGLVMVGSASPVGSFETGVALYVNDYLNDDFDGDGLGRELENEIGTNPGSESGPPGEGRDTDGDGIWDGFEVLGIRTGDTGYPEQALPTWGADPRHKDVFIESDLFYNCDGDRAICPVSECGSRLTGNAAMVVGDVASKCSGGAGFLNNPDGRNGFSIHIDSGLNNMEEPVNSVYGSWGGSNTIYRPEAGVKPSYDQLMRDSWHNDLYFNRIRRGIFRYSIGTPSGQNLFEGQGSIAAPVNWINSRSSNPGNILIHELGHNLGLRHYGKCEPGSNYNYKPNYISLMNYEYSYHGTPNITNNQRRDRNNLRFSEGERRFALDDNNDYMLFGLDLSSADETVRFPFYKTYHSNASFDLWSMLWYGILEGREDPNQIDPSWVMVDWDRSGSFGGSTRADALHYSYSQKIRVEFDSTDTDFAESLRFGPQMIEHGNVLCLFYVPREQNIIRYNQWYEGVFCDPDDVGDIGGELGDIPWQSDPGLKPYCGYMLGTNPANDVNVDIKTQMSAVTIPGCELCGIDVFYLNSQHKLCVVSKTFIAVDPLLPNWCGPNCSDYTFNGPPEAVYFNEHYLVFDIEEPESGSYTDMGHVKVVVIDPINVTQTDTWSIYQLEVTDEYQQTRDLESMTTPAVAVDPGIDSIYGNEDDSLLGVYTNEDNVMEIFKGDIDPTDYYHYEKLAHEQHWFGHPLGVEKSYKTYNRPALFVERPAFGGPKWTLWFYQQSEPNGLAVAKGYYRLTSSFAYQDGTEGITSFSLQNMVNGLSLCDNMRNVSLASYKGKMRAAYSYDRYLKHTEGFIFCPLADGIFRTSLRDVNDLEIIGDKMAESTVMIDKSLFEGITEGDLREIERLNHVNLINIKRLGDPESQTYVSCFPDNE